MVKGDGWESVGERVVVGRRGLVVWDGCGDCVGQWEREEGLIPLYSFGVGGGITHTKYRTHIYTYTHGRGTTGRTGEWPFSWQGRARLSHMYTLKENDGRHTR